MAGKQFVTHFTRSTLPRREVYPATSPSRYVFTHRTQSHEKNQMTRIYKRECLWCWYQIRINYKRWFGFAGVDVSRKHALHSIEVDSSRSDGTDTKSLWNADACLHWNGLILAPQWTYELRRAFARIRHRWRVRQFITCYHSMNRQGEGKAGYQGLIPLVRFRWYPR